jgi:abequosyltransferase
VSGVSLSVCIPTHHGWARLVEEAIEGVVSQLTPELAGRVEICVSDNASHDETEALVRALAARPGVRLVYARNDRDRGASFNIARSVELASGDYCWLHSSDDRLEEGALARILELLDANPGTAGATVARTAYDLDLAHPVVVDDNPDYVPSSAAGPTVFRTLEDALTNCAFVFTYLSTHVVDRLLWLEAMDEIRRRRPPATRYFLHVAAIGVMLRRRPVWVWCPEPLVRYRFGHSALTEDGRLATRYVPRFVFDLVRLYGWLLGAHPEAYRAIRARFQALTTSPAAIRAFKSAPDYSARRGWLLLARFTILFARSPEYWRVAVPRMLVPRAAIRLVRGR